LSAYLDGELGDAARGRLVAHLETCAKCRTQYAGLERVHALFGGAERYAAPPTFSWRIAAALRSGEALRRPFFPVALRVAAQAVALMAVVVVGVASGSFLASGPVAGQAVRPSAPLSLDLFAAAPPDSPGGAYLALTERVRE
jgi:anti-sigma factor RsiW